MTKCTAPVLQFPRCQRRQVQAEFTGGDITSDGGVILLRQVDKRLGLLAAVDRVLPDPRDPHSIKHSQLSRLRQRVYGLCLGYEDRNDHTTLRTDVALQTALEQKAGSFMDTTITIVFYRCTCSVAINCWSATYVPATSMAPRMPGRFWYCW